MQETGKFLHVRGYNMKNVEKNICSFRGAKSSIVIYELFCALAYWWQTSQSFD